MRVYVGYQFTGEDPQAAAELLQAVKAALEKRGVEMACPFFDVPEQQQSGMTPRDYMLVGFELLSGSEVMLALQSGPRRSEGMLMEVGYAWAKGVPVVVATRDDVTETYLPTMGARAVRWRDHAELSRVISELDWPVGKERR